MEADRPQRRTRWSTVLLLVIAVGFMAAITLLPIGWQLNRFVVWIYYEGLHINNWPNNEWITLELIAHLLNVVMTIPIGLLARLALPRWPWWVVPLVVLVLSAGVETAQWLLPLAREAQVMDVVTNTVGGVIGSFSAERIVRHHHRVRVR